jgi:hypothetical protein|tara:strand:- start:1041 stop:2120 length:1080 start_codon:yes stop_codon:yes gene_type:complete
MNKWQEFLKEARKLDSPPRKSAAGIRRSIGALTQQGGETKGSPYKDVEDPLEGKEDEDEISAPPGAAGGLEEKRSNYRKRVQRYTKDRNKLLNVGGQKNTPPYTQKMGSHVTFDRQLGEEVEPESFEKKPVLNPKFWSDNELKNKIQKRLIKIAMDFVEGLWEQGGFGHSIDVEDIRFTGSLANYNWSKYSDVDLHIVIDFSKIDEDVDLVKGFFDSARALWNSKHAITIYGHEVEVYVENKGEVHKSSGIYSITDEKWIVEPTPEKIEFDYVTARKKADAIQTEANLIDKFIDDNPKQAYKSVDRLKNKISRMRRAGLNSPAKEYSAENIAFKILRREETLQKISDLKIMAFDSILSL